MDLVQLTTHIDATAVRIASDAPAPYATREAREEVDRSLRAQLRETVAVVLFDRDTHEVHELRRGASVRIGRSVTADVLLEDPMVSRKHAVIEHADEHVRVLDDRSLNGVFVNGERVEEQRPLTDGDEVQIAGFVLRVIVVE